MATYVSAVASSHPAAHHSTFPPQLDVVSYLADKGVHIDRANDVGITPTWIAASRGHVRRRRRLVSAVASPRRTTNYLFQPPQLGIVQLLAKKGANLNRVNSDEVSPLLAAVGNNQLATVRFLADKGDINRAMKNGNTPTDVAARMGFHEVLRFLEEVADQKVAGQVLATGEVLVR